MTKEELQDKIIQLQSSIEEINSGSVLTQIAVSFPEKTVVVTANKDFQSQYRESLNHLTSVMKEEIAYYEQLLKLEDNAS